jgi:hypothetical protein
MKVTKIVVGLSILLIGLFLYFIELNTRNEESNIYLKIIPHVFIVSGGYILGTTKKKR